jgi:hypothetical protein
MVVGDFVVVDRATASSALGRRKSADCSRLGLSLRKTGAPQNSTFAQAAKKVSEDDSDRSELASIERGESRRSDCSRWSRTGAADPDPQPAPKEVTACYRTFCGT